MFLENVVNLVPIGTREYHGNKQRQIVDCTVFVEFINEIVYKAASQVNVLLVSRASLISIA